MLKQRIIVVFVVVTLAASYVYFNKKESAPATHMQPIATHSLNGVTKPSGLSQYLKAPRVNFNTLISSSSPLPESCTRYFDELQKMNLATRGQGEAKLSYQNLPAMYKKCPFAELGMAKAKATYLEACLPKDKNLSEEISDQCSSSLFVLRALITKAVLKDKPLKEIKDMFALADLLFAEFASYQESGEDLNFSKTKEITDQMLEINPSSYGAAKMNAASEMILAMQSNEWTKAEQSLARMNEINPDDPTMEDTQIAVATRGLNPERAYAYAHGMIEKNPEHAKGWFLLAFAQWARNERESSFASLQKAMSLDPQNQSYKKTWVEIHKPDAHAGSFARNFSVGVSSSDFEN